MSLLEIIIGFEFFEVRRLCVRMRQSIQSKITVSWINPEEKENVTDQSEREAGS